MRKYRFASSVGCIVLDFNCPALVRLVEDFTEFLIILFQYDCRAGKFAV